MNKHKYFIRFIVFWYFFISGFALLLYSVRIGNNRLAGDLVGYEFLLEIERNPVVEWLEWYGFNGYLILISAVALANCICLLVKKIWGRVLSIILGITMLPLGIFLLITNFHSTNRFNEALFDRISDYFLMMGARLSYVELVCICYGIFASVYFNRKNVKSYLSKNRD